MAAPSVGARSFDPLDPERRLAELARAGGPLRRVVAALAGRLVARRAWEPLSFRGLGDYARERLGVSARSLQEFARVDARLRELPRLEAALVSGGLPWSKVRLLARFVSVEDEAGWIGVARRVGVRVLERELRAVDRGAIESGALAVDEEGRDAEPCETVRVRAPGSLCFKWQRTQRYAAKVAGEALPAGAVLELVTAEVLSALPRGAGVEVEGPARPRERPEAASVCAPQAFREDSPGPASDAESASVPEHAELPVFLRPLVEGLEHLGAFEIDARLRRAIRLEQRLDAEIAPLLRHVTAGEYDWRATGYRTLAAFARERLGMSPRKARALVRLERVAGVCPELRSAWREGRLSWVQAQILAPLLVGDDEGDWRPIWVRFARTVTVERLGVAVDRALLLREANPEAWVRCRSWPDGAIALDGRGCGPPGRQVCARPREILEGLSLRVVAPLDVARLFRAVLCSVRRAIERETGRLPTEAEGFEAMIDHALTSWEVEDRWLRTRRGVHYRVFERDDWLCQVPGCTSRRNLHAHHIRFRSAGGSDALENLITLCAFHHQRGVHGGTLRITGSAPEDLWFELGLRDGQPPLLRYRSGGRLAYPSLACPS